jgi:hypothetical protein
MTINKKKKEASPVSELLPIKGGVRKLLDGLNIILGLFGKK